MTTSLHLSTPGAQQAWTPFGIPQLPIQPSSFAGKTAAPTFPSAADEAILRRCSCSLLSVAYWASS